MLFSFVQVSGYLGTLEKSQKYILKISVLESSVGPKGGHRAARRVPGAAQLLAAPPALLGGSHPLVPYIDPYLFSRRGNIETEVAFSIYAAESLQPSVLPRRANLEAELASSEGEIIAIIIVITSPSPLHDFLHYV